MSLIMVHANHYIILTTFHFWKNGVRRKWPFGMNTKFFCRLYRWNNFINLFRSKQSIFSSMRI